MNSVFTTTATTIKKLFAESHALITNALTGIPTPVSPLGQKSQSGVEFFVVGSTKYLQTTRKKAKCQNPINRKVIMEFRKSICRVCGTTEVCHPGPAGITYLPRDWERMEDRLPDRKSAMTEVCSVGCKMALKEWNRQGYAKRMGGV